MILNNYIKLRRWVDNGYYSSGDWEKSVAAGDNTLHNSEAIMINGNPLKYSLYYGNTSYIKYALTNSCLKSRLFPYLSSATNISADDYNVNGDITSSFANLNISVDVQYSTPSGNVTQISVSGVNNSGNGITIRQIAIAKEFYSGGFSGADIVGRVLFIKHNLDNEITLANGESFNIVILWNDNMVTE